MRGWEVAELAELWEACARENRESGGSFIYTSGDMEDLHFTMKQLDEAEFSQLLAPKSLLALSRPTGSLLLFSYVNSSTEVTTFQKLPFSVGSFCGRGSWRVHTEQA